MFTKHTIIALAAAASVGQVSAAHLGHRHHHLNPRVVSYEHTEVVVDIVTEIVYVTAGQEQTPQPTQSATSTSAAPAASSAPVQIAAIVQSSSQQPSTLVTLTSATSSTLSSTTTSATSTSTSTSTPTVELPVPTTTTTAAPIIPTLLPSTTAAAPSSSASPAPAPATGSKRGAAFNDASLVNALCLISNKITWAYNWGSTETGLTTGVEYIPMLWGSAHTDGWTQDADQAIANGASALLSCNEPDIAAQSNMSPSEAATFHSTYMNPFAGKARIGSPAISSSENPGQGLDWLSQFFTACPECVVDFCAIHWYGPGGTDGAATFLQHVKDAHTSCQNKPIWVTEFNAESGDVDQFYSTVLTALDSDEYSFVERYSPFYVATGYIMSSSTALSSVGQIFALQS